MNMRMIQDVSDFIFVEDKIEKSDIIFIPGGPEPELGEKAAELWKLGFAPLVMTSGGVSIKTGKFSGVASKQDIYCGDYKSEGSFLCDVLLKNGVSNSAVIQEDRSGFTKENAFFSRKTANERGLSIKKAILCCKGYHARRCLLLYEAAFPETEFFVCPVPYFVKGNEISKNAWFRSETGIDYVMGELQRCGGQLSDCFKRLCL